jgi:predicted transcriptional regulator
MLSPTEITELQESGFTFEEIQDIQAWLDDSDHGRVVSMEDAQIFIDQMIHSKILANA